jgi:hypothetical protein
MKLHLPFLFMALILSCNGKKSEILDKIELYQDSLQMASVQNADLAARMDHFVYPHSDKPVDSATSPADRKKDMTYLNSLQYRKMRDSAFVLKWKINQYQLQIESLYMELKKY